MRLDVRKMLIHRGWAETQGEFGVLRKGGACWATAGTDSFLSGPSRGNRSDRWTIDFGAGLPASVIVAACEAAADQQSTPLP